MITLCNWFTSNRLILNVKKHDIVFQSNGLIIEHVSPKVGVQVDWHSSTDNDYADATIK